MPSYSFPVDHPWVIDSQAEARSPSAADFIHQFVIDKVEESITAGKIEIKNNDEMLLTDKITLRANENMIRAIVKYLNTANSGSMEKLDNNKPHKLKSLPGWPRFWELGQYLLPKKTRKRIYEPAHQELLEDHILIKKRYRTKWAKRWLNFCFAFRTLLLFSDCWRALLANKAFQMLLKLVPVPIREWWSSPRF